MSHKNNKCSLNIVEKGKRLIIANKWLYSLVWL